MAQPWNKLTPEPNSPDLGLPDSCGRRKCYADQCKQIVSKYRWWRNVYFNTVKHLRGIDRYIISDITASTFYGVDLAKNVIVQMPVFLQVYNKGKLDRHSGNTGQYFYGNALRRLMKANSGGTFVCLLHGPVSNYSTQRLYKSTGQGDTWVKVTDEV